MWNFKSDIYRTEWLDLVFADRNKLYGAYELRQHNNQTTLKALLAASGLITGIVVLIVVFSRPDSTTLPADIIPADREVVVQLSKIPERKVIERAPGRPAPARTQPQKVKVTKFVNLNVVPARDVTEEIAAIEDIRLAVPGSENTEGVSTAGSADLPATGGPGSSDAPAPGTGNEVVSVNFLEEYPEFPGGERAFAKYLSKNLRYPYAAIENNISGRVIVGFIIEKNGDLSEVKVLRGIGGGCDEEAVRVLKNAPAWKPGRQNGRAVRVAYTMPVYFQLSDR